MRKALIVLLASWPVLCAADFDYATASDAELLARYNQLRAVDLDPNGTAVVENVSLEKAGTAFRFKSGSLFLFQPVAGKVAGAVFIGEGTLSVKPPDEMERKQFGRFLDGETELEEPFKEMVLFATDDTLSKLSADLKLRPGQIPGNAASALADFRKTFREKLPILNVEARTVAGLCSAHDPFLFADIRGQKHGRLLFAFDTQSEDEVQLIHHSGRETLDIWTAFHAPGVPDVRQRALVDTIHAKIDTTLEKSKRLSASAEIEFTSLADGARLLLVQLTGRLRVSKITAGGVDLKLIQEDKKKDAQLWVILPKPLAKGEKCVWKLDYSGDEVVRNAGEGNFYVGKRENWFPKLDIPGESFNDRAAYQLRFQTPKEYTLIATGKLVKRSVEGKQAISEWETEVPYPVVGFNYGRFKSKSQTEGATEITVYANEAQNDELRGIEMAIDSNPEAARDSGMMSGGLNTVGMLNSAVGQTQNAVRIYTHYFGPLPFKSLSITQQPSGFYGQSWPTLVFMPYTAFLDGTTRNQLQMDRNKSENQFLDQVGPHEVAHQWWGHMVGWKGYRDQWLSEGFAEYSAGLFVQMASGEKKFMDYLRLRKEEITSPLRNTSIRAIDAGPIYLGRRLDCEKTPGAYDRLVYAKGAYVLHMLRMMNYDFLRHDDSHFIAMMRDFVSTYGGRDASTEDFKAIVEKHFGGDMTWFFNQWVYGTEMPKITVEYGIAKNEKGAMLQGTITQRGVSKDFWTIMPMVATFGDKRGSLRIAALGESTPFSVQLPAEPDSIEFNPLQAILCDLAVRKQ